MKKLDGPKAREINGGRTVSRYLYGYKTTSYVKGLLKTIQRITAPVGSLIPRILL